MGVIEVVAVPVAGRAEVIGGTIGRRGPTAMGELVPPEAPGFPGSGWAGGGSATGGFPPDVKTTAVPLSATVCGLPLALSKMARVPAIVPASAATGVKVTEMAQLAPALTLDPQGLI